ncbi:SA1362 family protein [Fictibacillus sp. Mic-4]|uniref:SA1362 family protein n=1 Tax=Fictibacillus TaxID=1329200 RepID=UPI0004045CF6|nr:SA1362 family protein [Fictibacillus gelatini]
MHRQFFNPLIWVIVALAVIGLVFHSPQGLFTRLIIIAVVLAIGFFLFQRLRPGEKGKYAKAVRQSKKKYGNHLSIAKKTTSSKAKTAPFKKRKREHNFTVIEGKKNKKKNRASF